MSEARAFLVKTEPETYSIDDLARDGRTSWEGVRNYQARNLMRDEMKLGDPVLIYHSNAEPPGIVGLARVSREAFPDPTAFDPASKYFDEGGDPASPRWLMVELAFVEKFPRLLPLEALKADPALAGLEVTRKGTRLSVCKVSPEHLARILALARP